MRQYDQILVDIVQYVYHYNIKEEKSFERARLLLLDSLGCAVESLSDVSIRRIIGPHVPGTIVPDGFQLPGTDLQLDPVKGTFDLGTMIRHPSDNLGAIIAVMGWLGRSSQARRSAHNGPPLNIRTLLVAMIKAYEIQGCFQVANSFNSVGIDHTILVKVASTAVTSWLFGLEEGQALAALSHVWMDGPPLRTFRAAPNTIPRKGWAAGDACMRAVHLVLMTRAGQDGSPSPLTAPRYGFYSSVFRGKEFSMPVPYGETIIHRTVAKLIACEGHGLTAAEAAVQLSKEMRLKGLDPAQDICKINVRTQLPAMTIINKAGDLFNAADRDHCMQYVIAVVLLKGSLIGANDYKDSSPWAGDPRVTKLREKIVMREDPDFSKAYYDLKIRSAATGISNQLGSGLWLDEAVLHFPVGHPSASGSDAAILSKLQVNLKPMFSDDEISRLQAALNDDEMHVHEYLDLWVRPRHIWLPSIGSSL